MGRIDSVAGKITGEIVKLLKGQELCVGVRVGIRVGDESMTSV